MILIAIPTPALSQSVGGGWTVEHLLEPATPGERLGSSLAAAGDINGDGTPDLVVGAPEASPGGLSFAGTVYVFSGATGAELLHVDGLVSGDIFGSAVAGVGDVDGDLVPDLLVGATGADPSGFSGAGSAFLLSGATGAQLRRFDGTAAFQRYGSAVAGINDVDGDGVGDLLVGAYSSGVGGEAYLISGASGVLIHTLSGGVTANHFGRSIAATHDVDGDGLQDILVGAPLSDPAGLVSAGSVFLFSSATGAELLSIAGAAGSEEFGTTVASIGDLDGDTLPEIAVGARGAVTTAGSAAGAIRVFSSATGLLQMEFLGEYANGQLGSSLAAPGDVDGDGIPDILGASPLADGYATDSGMAHLWSGSDGRRLNFFAGSQAQDRLGSAVSAVGDLDGDGRADIAVGAHESGYGGEAYLYGGYQPHLSATAYSISSSAGGQVDYSIEFGVAAAGQAYGLLASDGVGPNLLFAVPIPLDPGPVFHRMLSGWSPAILTNSNGTLDPAGAASSTLQALPGVLSGHIGSLYWVIAVAYQPGIGIEAVSVALPLTIGP